MNRNTLFGMVIGGAIGDAWGMPVETWSPERIREVYPNGITNFIPPKDHKWYDPIKTPAGTTTDDTQLTIATMKGLISGSKKSGATFSNYMDSIAHEHCMAARATMDGWGTTTRDAVRRLTNGVRWDQSGKTSEANRGTGNGVPMKCSPLAAWAASPAARDMMTEDFKFHQWCVSYSAMTHYSKMSAYATLCHVNAVLFCLNREIADLEFNQVRYIATQWPFECEKDNDSNSYSVAELSDSQDNIQDRMNKLTELRSEVPDMEQDEIIQSFGTGSCYIYDSLPFSYAWFIKNPWSIRASIHDVIHAGGDTDTNAKIVGEMLGALHGYDSIKTYLPWAISGLIGHDQLLAVADEFCDTFGIK